MKRKEFIRIAGRYALIGAMAAMSFSLFKRNKLTVSAECSDNKLCRDCTKYGTCKLPQALKERNNERK